MAKYADIRSQIKSGDVFGWTHKSGWFSSWYDFKINFVRLWQRSKYSHVGIAITLAGRVFIIESVTGGIRLEPLSKFLPCDWAPFKELDEEGIERAMSVCGEPYSQIEAVLAAFDEDNPDSHEWQCAKFVKWALRLDCRSEPAAVMDYALAQDCSITEIHE